MIGVDAWSQCRYVAGVKTTLISIGNSRGVRIPKPVIEQCGLVHQIEMTVQDRTLLIHAPRKPRAGWKDAFTKMAHLGDDKLLDPQSPSTAWDDEDWQWK